MDENKITFLSEKFENKETGELVPSVTLLIDGNVKKTFDFFIENEEKYESYESLLADIILAGVQKITEKYKF